MTSLVLNNRALFASLDNEVLPKWDLLLKETAVPQRGANSIDDPSLRREAKESIRVVPMKVCPLP